METLDRPLKDIAVELNRIGGVFVSAEFIPRDEFVVKDYIRMKVSGTKERIYEVAMFVVKTYFAQVVDKTIFINGMTAPTIIRLYGKK